MMLSQQNIENMSTEELIVITWQCINEIKKTQDKALEILKDFGV